MILPPVAFRCPHCGTLLTIPAHQAGVQGPCPACAHEIRAPMPGTPPGYPHSYYTPPTHTPTLRPHPQTPPQEPDTPKQATGAKVPIEPRVTASPSSQRSSSAESREKPGPSGEIEILPVEESSGRESSRYILLRAVAPLIFLASAGFLVFAVVKRLKDPDETPATPNAGQHTATESTATGTNDPTSPAEAASPTAPHATRQHIELSPSATTDAVALLEKFLSARSLEERLPMLETKTPGEELASSILASPLPAFRNLTFESRKSFPMENIVDMYFRFEFIEKDLTGDPQTMVVRHRGGFPPRILADPFLDLYGGRLATYAAKPQTKARLFHVVATPFPTCNDLKIPDRGKKITLRLLPAENSEKVTYAYVSRVSKIGEDIGSGHYDLTYGKPQPCVILLDWNTEESPGTPYLEALDIRAYHWNP